MLKDLIIVNNAVLSKLSFKTLIFVLIHAYMSAEDCYEITDLQFGANSKQ